MSLAQPPFIEHLLLENPWPAVAAFAAIGAALLWLGRTRGHRRQLAAGGIALALAVVLYMVATLVTTPREQCIAETERLVNAFTPLQMNEIRSVVDENVTLAADGGIRDGSTVFASIEATANSRYGLQSHSIKQIDAEAVSPGHVRVLFDVLTIATNGRVITRWLLDWRRPGDDAPWQLVAIEWLASDDTMMGMKPNLGAVPR